MDKEVAIANFRKAFKDLPKEFREREVIRLYKIVSGESVIVFEDHETGKRLKFLTIGDLIEFLWQNKRVSADRSFIYKVLKGQYKQAYGYEMYYEKEEEI